jgi:hypothetical protein
MLSQVLCTEQLFLKGTALVFPMSYWLDVYTYIFLNHEVRTCNDIDSEYRWVPNTFNVPHFSVLWSLDVVPACCNSGFLLSLLLALDSDA